jgi:hypothetical protein
MHEDRMTDDIAKAAETGIMTPDVEAKLMALPQEPCPVTHHFGPGIYIREVHMPAGTLIVGRNHRAPHLNIMLKGALLLLDGDRRIPMRAPQMFTSQGGRKTAYIIEDTVWQNLIATDETNIAKIEAMMFDDVEVYTAHHAQALVEAREAHQPDRDDFDRFLVEEGLTAVAVRLMSEDLSDQMSMPEGFLGTVQVWPSPIEGNGLFTSSGAKAGQVICPARLGGKRTPAGRYANHSATPNAHFVATGQGDILLVALRDIRGCHGGDHGEEITVDYRQAVATARGAA